MIAPNDAAMITGVFGMGRPPRKGTQRGATSPHGWTRPRVSRAADSLSTLSATRWTQPHPAMLRSISPCSVYPPENPKTREIRQIAEGTGVSAATCAAIRAQRAGAAQGRSPPDRSAVKVVTRRGMSCWISGSLGVDLQGNGTGNATASEVDSGSFSGRREGALGRLGHEAGREGSADGAHDGLSLLQVLSAPPGVLVDAMFCPCTRWPEPLPVPPLGAPGSFARLVGDGWPDHRVRRGPGPQPRSREQTAWAQCALTGSRRGGPSRRSRSARTVRCSSGVSGSPAARRAARRCRAPAPAAQGS